MKSHLAILVLTAWSALGPARCSALDATGRPAAPQKVASEAIIWVDSQHTRALFVPESILNSAPLEEIPLSPADRKALVERLPPPAHGGSKSSLSNPQEGACEIQHSTGKGPGPDAVPLVELVRDHRNFLVVGRVLRVIPGINVGYRYVSSMVQIAVEEVLKSPGSWPAVGEQIFYEQEHARVEVHGRVFCLKAEGKEYFRATPGQQVLVLGDSQWDDPRLLFGTLAWQVSDEGMVLPESFGAVRQETPIALQEIRQSLLGGQRK